MSKNSEKLIKLLDRLDKLERLIPSTVKAVLEIPMEVIDECNGALYTFTNPGELRIDMPYNINKYRLLRRHLGGNWKSVNKRFHDTLGSWFIKFQHKKFDVTLDIELKLVNDLAESSSCKLIKIGERHKNVYRLECN